MKRISLTLAAVSCLPAAFAQQAADPSDNALQVLSHPGGAAAQFLANNATWQPLIHQPGALLFSGPNGKRSVITGNVTHQDPATGAWVQNDPTLSLTANGWRLDGTANSVLIRKSGITQHVITQTFSDYATKHSSTFSLTVPTLTYGKDLRLQFVKDTQTWSLVFDQSGAFRIETTVAKKRGAATYSFPVNSSENLTVDSVGELFGNEHAGLTRAVMIPRFGKAVPCTAWIYAKTGTASFTCDDSSFTAAQFPYRIDPDTNLTLTDTTDTFNISSWCGQINYPDTDFSCGGNNATASFNFSPYIPSNSTNIQFTCGYNVSDSDIADGDSVKCTVLQPINVSNTVVQLDFNTNFEDNCFFSNQCTFSDSATINYVNATAYWTPPPAAALPTINGQTQSCSLAVYSVSGPTSATLATSTSGASIRYTLDGSTPTDTHGTLYTAPFIISAPTALKLMAYGSLWGDSCVATADYDMAVGVPLLSPAPGTYPSATITLSAPSYSAPYEALYYSLNGSTPSILYTGPFTLPGNSTVTVEVMGVTTTLPWLSSSIATASYTITGTVAPPIFAPAGGSYSSGQSVTLSDTTAGTTIIYTTDGSIPTYTHGTVYTGTPISVSASMTIKALAYKASWADNSATASYLIVYPGAPITGSNNGPTSGSPTADSGNGLDPRRAGVRALGSYWGASGENIDTSSGNLNFSSPVIKPVSRGGWSVPFALSYNSQLWRNDSGGTWLLGQDVGYGMGWKLQAGSITPIWVSPTQFDHYIYTDATGAEYSLSVSTNNVWTSKEGVYISYDATSNRLYSTDGSFWYMGCQSSGGEQDAGTLYPTLIQDTNGNQIQIAYQAGAGSGVINSSSRISAIYDPRNGNGPSYVFTYNSDAIPHLLTVQAGPYQYLPGEAWQFTYSNASLVDPFLSASHGTAALLATAQQTPITTGSPAANSFSYNNSAELTQYTTPMGGSINWVYQSFTYSGSIKVREVQNRTINDLPASLTNSWTFTHPTTDSSLTYHSSTDLLDNGALSHKVYGTGMPLSGTNLVVPTSYEEHNPDNSVLLHKDFAWTQDAAGNAYVGTTTATLNPGTGSAVTSKAVQVLDTYGNLIQQQLYDYPYNPAHTDTTTPFRTYVFTYLADTNYTARYIRNRLLQASVNGVGFAQNTYDGTTVGPLVDGLTQYLHDSTFDVSFAVRGNPTSSANPQSYAQYAYRTTGVPYRIQDGTGMTVNVTTDASTSYSLPSVLTPNSNNNLATSMTYTAAFTLSSVTGANGVTNSITSDAFNRPFSVTSADGAAVGYSYTYSPNTQTATTGATVNNITTTQWTRNTFDGFGRTIKVETGHDAVTTTVVDTLYGPCGCSPLGKMTAVSLPHAPGGSVYWTTYTYDGSGRTLTATKSDGSVTTTSYSGNTTTVTDPAGKWKTFYSDMAGGTTVVVEPDPNNASPSSNPITYYYRNGLGQITTVSVQRGGVVQNRSYVWSGSDLASSTEPETGTTTYSYDANHHITQRTDAKGQQTQYTRDAYGRLVEVRHYTPTGPFGALQEQTNQRVDYFYDTNPIDGNYSHNSWGRLTAVVFLQQLQWRNHDQFAYLFDYNQAGRILGNRLMVGDGGSNILADLNATYAWDNQGRMTNMTYPSGTALAYQYDALGGLSGITQNGTSIVTASYTPLGQLSTLQYGSLGESRTYNTLMQLTHLTNAGVDMQYIYSAGHNNGRVSQTIDGILNETVNYQYDMWNRLATATATNGTWGEQYTFDGFGNLTGKTPTVGSAPSMTTSFDPATNRPVGGGYDANGNPGSPTYTWDVENRLVSTLPTGIYSTDYTYDPSGRRMWKEVDGGRDGNHDPLPSSGEIYFYGANGLKLETYTFSYNFAYTGILSKTLAGTNLYFGNKLLQSKGVWVATDRLGNVRANSNGEHMSYFPYGEERTATPDGREKFGTYTRDGIGQDYANARYYSANSGSFWNPDPSGIVTVDSTNPLSWNRTAYTKGDPINSIDPQGTADFSVTVWGWDYPPPPPPVGNPWDPCADPDTTCGGGPSEPEPESPLKPNCPPVPIAPAGASVKQNIQAAETVKAATSINVGDSPSVGRSSTLIVKLQYIYSMLRNHGPWDYKQQGSQYQDFGNFDFGAVGAALGIDLDTLLRGAGFAQMRAGTSKPAWGKWDGNAPFGDDPDDQAQIKGGYAYYQAVKGGCN